MTEVDKLIDELNIIASPNEPEANKFEAVGHFLSDASDEGLPKLIIEDILEDLIHATLGEHWKTFQDKIMLHGRERLTILDPFN